MTSTTACAPACSASTTCATSPSCAACWTRSRALHPGTGTGAGDPRTGAPRHHPLRRGCLRGDRAPPRRVGPGEHRGHPPRRIRRGRLFPGHGGGARRKSRSSSSPACTATASFCRYGKAPDHRARAVREIFRRTRRPCPRNGPRCASPRTTRRAGAAVVSDYIAGMTDRYALAQARKFLGVTGDMG